MDGKGHGIVGMGKILAKEIKTELQRLEHMGCLGKISMVGHSLGGIIIRSALKYITKTLEYKERLEVFMSLGTPHCGYVHSNSKLLSTGMWLVEKLTKNSIISQIRLSDAAAIKETALYKLSKDKSIGYFKKILFVGSTKDTYASYESACVHDSDRLRSISNSESVRMLQRKLLERVQECEVYRLNVNTKQSNSTLDTYIGRQAHIQFIENQDVIKSIIYRYDNLFA